MLGFDIDSHMLTISLPEAKIAGARVLFGKLYESQGSRALEVVTLQQVRWHIEHFKPSNAIWNYLTGPVDLLLRYTNECSTRVNSPTPEAWVAFRVAYPSFLGKWSRMTNGDICFMVI